MKKIHDEYSIKMSSKARLCLGRCLARHEGFQERGYMLLLKAGLGLRWAQSKQHHVRRAVTHQDSSYDHSDL